jgi:dethiobiotin synthetase/adenosylmethionine--8-amino-7-oxononanoate aminotransferase
MSGNAQADAYRPLFLPTILVGDPKLGGISSTISAYESLLLRGYRIDGVAMFRDPYYRNFEYLAQYFMNRSVSFSSVPPPPEKLQSLEENYNSTEKYYSQIVDEERDGEILNLEENLDKAHVLRLEDLESMPRRTLDTVWWPFVQHGSVKGPEDVTVIDSACGDLFSVYNTTSVGNSSEPSTSLLSPKFDGEDL